MHSLTPTDSPGPSQPRTWLTDVKRVASLCATLTAQPEVRVLIDGVRQPMLMRVSALRAEVEPGRGPRELLALRPVKGECIVMPFAGGGQASVWFSDSAGVYAFRTSVVGVANEALLVPPPLAFLRFVRRDEVRFIVTPEASTERAPRFFMSDDPEGRSARIVNISLSGVLVEIEGGAAPAAALYAGLSANATHGKRVEAPGIVRRTRPLPGGRFEAAVEFEATPLTRAAVTRLLDGIGTEAQVEPYVVQSLPAPVRGMLDAPPVTDDRGYPRPVATAHTRILKAS